jgi:hypothetical protein
MTDSQTPTPTPTHRAKPKSAGLKKYERKVARTLWKMIMAKDLRLKIVSAELEKLGIRESEKGLSAKLAKGTFSAAYFFALKEVIDSFDSSN